VQSASPREGIELAEELLATRAVQQKFVHYRDVAASAAAKA
jgi:hypothetical protein